MFFNQAGAFMFAAGLACFGAAGMARAETAITPDVLHSPERATAMVSTGQQDAYRKLIRAYTQEEAAHPKDAGLVLARCRFIQTFSYSEEISWADAALDDFESCKKELETRYSSDAEASLFMADQHEGKDAVSFARSLLPASSHWTLPQRARLHAVLARAYSAANQKNPAGQEALAAVQLDPGSDQLVSALRYLATSGRTGEAEALLARTPVDPSRWKEWSRVSFAADSLSPAAALAELQRAGKSEGPFNDWLAARIYLRAGKTAEAVKALARAGSCSCDETVQQFQTRLNVAVAAGDGKTASVALQAWFTKTGITGPLLFAYGNLLRHEPSQLFSSTLLHLALSMLALMLVLAYVPSLIAFPAHYRGTVRARLNKSTVPLFERVGLRQLWIAFGVFLIVSVLVPLLGGGSSLQALATNKLLSNDEQATIAALQLSAMLLGGVLLAPIAWCFSRREWLGRRGLITAIVIAVLWTLVKALWIWSTWHAGQHGALTGGNLHDRTIAMLALAFARMGGPAFAFLVIAVAVPIYEELIFRGCLLGGLTRHISFGWANIWQALLFAVMHNDMPHFLFYFLLGLSGGWLARQTRGLAAPIALHAANNAVACAAMLLSG
ncbi:type II CAAX endopeptidase family protein [Dyella choica]|nr:type II CAAX endopeptidase family protein [Dyella choica]